MEPVHDRTTSRHIRHIKTTSNAVRFRPYTLTQRRRPHKYPSYQRPYLGPDIRTDYQHWAPGWTSGNDSDNEDPDGPSGDGNHPVRKIPTPLYNGWLNLDTGNQVYLGNFNVPQGIYGQLYYFQSGRTRKGKIQNWHDIFKRDPYAPYKQVEDTTDDFNDKNVSFTRSKPKNAVDINDFIAKNKWIIQ